MVVVLVAVHDAAVEIGAKFARRRGVEVRQLESPALPALLVDGPQVRVHEVGDLAEVQVGDDH